MNMRFASLAIAAGLLLAACAGPAATTRPSTAVTTAPSTAGAPTTAPTPPAATAPAGISGNVDIHGSSTVAPISNAVAEDLKLTNPDFSYFVGDEGTGDGFKLFFCVDGSDIADASRKIKPDDPAVEGDEEATICAANAIDYTELKIAYDGLAVITAAANPLECLSFADLYALMGPESDAVTNWNEAETLAHELGSTTDLPDAPLSITAPGDESGTYDSFIELALAKIIAAQFPEAVSDNTHLRAPGPIYVASANDNAIIQGVAGFPTSLGFVGLHFAEENADTVKTLGIDKGDGTCVVPTIETVSDGTYPISRPLFIYPNLGRAAENPAIVPFVDFYLSDEGIVNATDVGYVGLPAAELDATRATWDAAKP